MKIEIVNVSGTKKGTGKNGKPYSYVELTYNMGGKEFGPRKVMQFDKDVFDVLSSAKPGEFYEITEEQDGQYKRWTSAEATEGESTRSPEGESSSAAMPRGNGASRGAYTATRDASIVKQVCLKAAAELISAKLGTVPAGSAVAVEAIGSAVKRLTLDLLTLFEETKSEAAEKSGLDSAKAAAAKPAAPAKVTGASVIEDLQDDIPF